MSLVAPTPTNSTSLASLKNQSGFVQPNTTSVNLETVAGFESMQRIAKLFASSSIVPKQYQGNLADCFIAVDMAIRMGANPLMVFQNLYSVHGNPAWSAQFLIATFNKCGRFSSLRYDFQGKEGQDDWGCRAIATELATKEKLTGPLVTIGLAKKEGWYQKNGSKWQTMPEMMLRYRAAAWFVRTYAPEIAMGLQTAEEVRDAAIIMEPGQDGSFEMSMDDIKMQEETLIDTEAGTDASDIVLDELSGIKTETQTESVTSKQSADRQRAAKAASRIKEKEPVQEELQDKEIPTASPVKLHAGDIQCPKEGPNGNPRIVSEEDCVKCAERTGCPAWEEEF